MVLKGVLRLPQQAGRKVCGDALLHLAPLEDDVFAHVVGRELHSGGRRDPWHEGTQAAVVALPALRRMTNIISILAMA